MTRRHVRAAIPPPFPPSPPSPLLPILPPVGSIEVSGPVLHTLSLNGCSSLTVSGRGSGNGAGNRRVVRGQSVATATSTSTSTSTPPPPHTQDVSRSLRRGSLERLRVAQFNGCRSLPEPALHRLVDHSRDLRRLHIQGACMGSSGGGAGGTGGAGGQEQLLKMKAKGGKRHKGGTYKEDARTRVRTKTTAGLQKVSWREAVEGPGRARNSDHHSPSQLGQKRTELVVVRNNKDLKSLPK